MNEVAQTVVENLLDDEGDPAELAKSLANTVKSDQDAELATLKASGAVSPQTVKTYDMIYHRSVKNADGTAARAKVTSIKTWKTRPGEFEIGWKHGMYQYGKISPQSAGDWTTIEPPAVPRQRKR